VALNRDTGNDRLPHGNRDGDLHQDWAGDDQDWWDWYVTLAENGDTPTELGQGPGLPSVAAATDDEAVVELAEPYPLTAASARAFREDAFVKLPGVLSPSLVRRLAERLDALLHAEHGTTSRDGSRPWSRCGATTTSCGPSRRRHGWGTSQRT
jgi:hypothetical protein